MSSNFSNILLSRFSINKIPFLFFILLFIIFSSIYSLPKIPISNTLPTKYFETIKTNYIEENTNLYLVSTRDGYLHALNNKKEQLWKSYLGQELMTSTLTARKITKNLYLFPFNEQIYLIDNGKIIPFDIYIKDLVKKQYISVNDFTLLGKTKTSVYIIDIETGEILQKIDEDSNFIPSKKIYIRQKNRRKKTIKVIRIDYILNCLEIKEGEKFWNASYSDIVIQRGDDNLNNNNKFFVDYTFLNKLINEYKYNNIENQEINYDNVITAYTYFEKNNFPIVKIYDRTMVTQYLDSDKNSEMSEEIKYLDDYNKNKYEYDETNSDIDNKMKIYEDLNKYHDELMLTDDSEKDDINKIIIFHIIMNYIKNNMILLIIIIILSFIIFVTLLYKRRKKKQNDMTKINENIKNENIAENLIKNDSAEFNDISRAKSIPINNNSNSINNDDTNNEEENKNNIMENKEIKDEEKKINKDNEESEEEDDEEEEIQEKENNNKVKKLSIWDEDDEDDEDDDSLDKKDSKSKAKSKNRTKTKTNSKDNYININNNNSENNLLNNESRTINDKNNNSELEENIDNKPINSINSGEIKAKKITRLDMDFENLEKIGEGGFGVVLKGTHKIDKYIYAIKIIDISNITDIKQKDDIIKETKKMSMIRDKYIVNYNICWYDDNLGSAEKFFESKNNEDNEDSECSLNSRGSNASIDTINKKSEANPFYSKYRFNCRDEFKVLDYSILSKKYNKEIKNKKQKQFFHILMEYCDGNTLQDLIKDHIEKKIPISRKLIYNYIRQILKGLKILHKNGIIHSDIKPGNIFLKKVGNLEQIKIGDFGLAMLKKNKGKLLSKDLKGYTPQYSSPEQLKPNGTYNEKIDIYASGIILYEMCGCFGSEMEKYMAIKELKTNRKILDEIEKNYKEESELIKIMTEEDYDKRPSAEQILKNDIFKELGKIVNE